ncbi:hypothetical protein HU200_027845 [Digitaria exilis]|uniref:Uncharacterized protein n=1 Tax=Digitaria exilis TaxID=1010633 RepID=A0A835BX34_9POAL|nr:hypothetical protein HU200_027845 [Digitaria exilis]
MHKNRRVAIALSRYCIYLMASAPELLLGPATQTTDIFRQTARRIRYVEAKDWLNSIGSNVLIHAMERKQAMRRTTTEFEDLAPIVMGMYFGKLLIGKEIPPPPGCTRRRSDDPWKLVALLWVQTLLYAAPYGDVEVHRQRLSQGGEFITHLWALLYHLGIDSWEHEEDAKKKEETFVEQMQKPVDDETTMTTSSSQQDAAGCRKGISTTVRLRRTRSLPTAGGLDY